MAMQEFFIDSGGIPIHAKLEMPEGEPGRCPVVIVQHGLTGHMEERHILAVAEAIREAGMATLRVELYGHGQSGGTFERHTLLKWVDEMLDVIDYAKGLDFATDLYLCGHSQGGLLTMLVAALRPDDLKAIIPMSPAICIVANAREGRFFQMTFDPEHVPDSIYRGDPSVPEDERRPSDHFSGDYFRVAQRLHPDEAIDGYSGPVLLVHGTADEGVPFEDSAAAAERYADARLVAIPGDTHCYDHHLDQVCDAVREFLAESDSV